MLMGGEGPARQLTGPQYVGRHLPQLPQLPVEAG
jgi:hypothetical protein